MTFSNTVLTGLVLNAGVDGILQVTCCPAGRITPGQETHNRWIDTRIIGNTIESQRGGVMVGVSGLGDLVDRTTITNNTVHVSYEGDRMDHDGIGLTIGAFPYSTDNRLSDLVVAYNSVEGGPDYGVRINTGVVGGTSNISEGIRIVGNHVNLTPATWLGGEARGGVVVGAGEGSEAACPECDEIIYSEDNVARNIEISGNVLGGPGGAAIGLFAGVSGAARNRVEDVHIEDNRIRGVAPSTGSGQSGVWIEGGFGSGYVDKSSADNVVSDVTVHANSIRLRTNGPKAELSSGGIALVGGIEANSGDVRDVLITNNRVDTEFVGISLVGGWAHPRMAATDNEVSHVRARCNVIEGDPTLINRVEPRVRGINLTGGTGFLGHEGPWSATGNKVTCIRLRDNLVAGVLNDVSVLPNVGTGASRNVASRRLC